MLRALLLLAGGIFRHWGLILAGRHPGTGLSGPPGLMRFLLVSAGLAAVLVILLEPQLAALMIASSALFGYITLSAADRGESRLALSLALVTLLIAVAQAGFLMVLMALPESFLPVWIGFFYVAHASSTFIQKVRSTS